MHTLAHRLASAFGLGLILTACAPAQSPQASTTTSSKPGSPSMNNKEQVRALLRSIETGDPAPVGFINPTRYTQHNLAVGDRGLQGSGAVMAQLPKGSARANPVRVFQDGDFVFAHTNYDFFGPKIGFDIFRFEDGKIVEHWDNLQETPKKAGPSGHTMLDGPTEATDLGHTDANKALVSGLVDDVLVNGRVEKLASYFDGDRYVQHNPMVADGVSGLGAALAEMARSGMTMKYTKVHKVLGEGNFVLTVSEGTFGGKATSFYDLFRVENGKIAEHWDTMEAIPPKAEWKNGNGKF